MRIFQLWGALLLFATLSIAQEIKVAAAVSYRYALEEIVSLYDQKVELIFGSSGKLYHQIENSAPFDMFMAADMKYPNEAFKKGFAQKPPVKTVENRLVIWTKRFDPAKEGLKLFLDPKIKKVAIANPKTAPLGERAVESMKNAGVYEQTEPKLVYGETVSQIVHFVENGAADAYSVIAEFAREGKGRFALIDAASHERMIFATVILKNSRHIEAAERFLAFLSTPKAKAVFEKHGLVPLL